MNILSFGQSLAFVLTLPFLDLRTINEMIKLAKNSFCE